MMIKNKKQQLEAKNVQLDAKEGFEIQRKESAEVDTLSTQTLRKLTVNE